MGEILVYGVYKSFGILKVGVPNVGTIDAEDDWLSRLLACSVESGRRSDWACFFTSKNVGVADRSVKEEQAR